MSDKRTTCSGRAHTGSVASPSQPGPQSGGRGGGRTLGSWQWGQHPRAQPGEAPATLAGKTLKVPSLGWGSWRRRVRGLPCWSGDLSLSPLYVTFMDPQALVHEEDTRAHRYTCTRTHARRTAPTHTCAEPAASAPRTSSTASQAEAEGAVGPAWPPTDSAPTRILQGCLAVAGSPAAKGAASGLQGHENGCGSPSELSASGEITPRSSAGAIRPSDWAETRRLLVGVGQPPLKAEAQLVPEGGRA